MQLATGLECSDDTPAAQLCQKYLAWTIAAAARRLQGLPGRLLVGALREVILMMAAWMGLPAPKTHMRGRRVEGRLHRGCNEQCAAQDWIIIM